MNIVTMVLITVSPKIDYASNLRAQAKESRSSLTNHSRSSPNCFVPVMVTRLAQYSQGVTFSIRGYSLVSPTLGPHQSVSGNGRLRRTPVVGHQFDLCRVEDHPRRTTHRMQKKRTKNRAST